MTDIVERLRNQLEYWNSGGRFEAADEIERLRAQHQEALDHWGKAMDERDRLRNLQHERSDSRAWLTVGALEAKNMRLTREVERLQAALNEQSECPDHPTGRLTTESGKRLCDTCGKP